MDTEIRLTADGSSTLFLPSLNEHYHSTFGAVQESEYIYIGKGMNCIDRPFINILEIGFGTGLNAILTYLRSPAGVKISYHSVEKFPLPWQTINKLRYDEFLGMDDKQLIIFRKMHECAWNKEVIIDPHFTLRKNHEDLQDFFPAFSYNLIYFDAFSPNIQPELWRQTVFNKLYHSLDLKGILVTYSAKGEIRRRLEEAGFTVNRLPGPPGKREILQAVKSQSK